MNRPPLFWLVLPILALAAAAGAQWTEVQQLTGSDSETNDFFGSSVAIDGDVMVVGAQIDDVGGNGDQGSAFVFRFNGSNWVEEQKLTASDGAGDDRFGTSVAVSGDVIVVGAYFDDVSTKSQQGSAYVYRYNVGSWNEEQKLTASDGEAGDFYGRSVGVSGGAIVVGSFFDDVGANTWQGSAYVYRDVGAFWIEEQILTASNGGPADQLGIAVAIDGNTILAGANLHDVSANINQGAAYIFEYSGSTWSETQELNASDGAGFDLFGGAVDVTGDLAIIGAPNAWINGEEDRGAAYVFRKTGGVWQEEDKLSASDGAPFDTFASSVAIDGNVAIGGALVHQVGAEIDQGAAYIYHYSGGGWSEQQKLLASDGLMADNFGVSAAIQGGVALVGSFHDDVGIQFNQGSAYIFTQVNSAKDWLLLH